MSAYPCGKFPLRRRPVVPPQFALGVEHEVVGRAQVGGQKALDCILSGDVVTDAGLAPDGRCEKLQHRPPRAAPCSVVTP